MSPPIIAWVIAGAIIIEVLMISSFPSDPLIQITAAVTWLLTLALASFYCFLSAAVLKRALPSLAAIERGGLAPFVWGAPLLSLWNILPTSFGLALHSLLFCLAVLTALSLREELMDHLGSLRLEMLLPLILPVLVFGSVHIQAGSLGPIAATNNDAFFYLPPADFLSFHSIRELPQPNPVRPSFHILHSYGAQGVTRAGFSVMAAHLLGILKFFRLPATALHVVPALNFFFVEVGTLFCFQFLRSIFIPIVPSALLTAALLYGIQLQRLYWENFYPATAGAMALLCAFFCFWIQNGIRPTPKRPFLASTLWQWTLWTLYPETLGYYFSFEIAKIISCAATSPPKACWDGLQLLAASIAAAALTPVAVYRYTQLLPMVAGLQRAPSVIPASFFQNYTLSLGVAPSFFGVQGFPVLGLILGSATLLGFIVFAIGVDHKRWFPLLGCASLAMALTVSHAAQRGEIYSIRRIFELNLYFVPLLGSFILSPFFKTKRTELLGYALSGFLLILGGAGHFAAQNLLARFIRAYQIYPTARDIHAINQVDSSKKLALVGAASMERSLFLSHFYLSNLDLQSIPNSAFAQTRLSYFYEGTLNPKHSPIADFISSEVGLFVSNQECLNRISNKPSYLDPLPPLYFVPFSEEIQFKTGSQTLCSAHVFPRSSILAVAPTHTGKNSSRDVPSRLKGAGTFELEFYEAGGAAPKKTWQLRGTEKIPVDLPTPAVAGQAILITAITEGLITSELATEPKK